MYYFGSDHTLWGFESILKLKSGVIMDYIMGGFYVKSPQPNSFVQIQQKQFFSSFGDCGWLTFCHCPVQALVYSTVEAGQLAS